MGIKNYRKDKGPLGPNRKPNKGPLRNPKGLFSFIFFVLVACPFQGQVIPKQHLAPKGYEQWGNLHPMAISPNGEWASSLLQYEQATDTLFIIGTHNDRTFIFPDGTGGEFSADSKWFAFQDPERGLGLLGLGLKDAKVQWTPQVIRFGFSKEGKYLLRELRPMESGTLEIKDLQKGSLRTIHGVVEYQWNPDRTLLAYTTEQGKSVHLVKFGKKLEDVTLENGQGKSYRSLRWNHTGTALAFLKEEGDHRISICLYNDLFATPKSYDLVEGTFPVFFRERRIMDHKMIISDDGQRVFFKVMDKSKLRTLDSTTSMANVQVWDTHDAWIYPRQKKNAGMFTRGWDAVWWAGTDSLLQITDPELPKMVLTGNQEHALTYSPLAHEPAPAERGNIDLYITSLQTGKRELFLEGQPDYLGITKISPGGKYISYYRQGHWWVYDIRQRTHVNITVGLDRAFHNKAYDRPICPPPYGHPGWTEDDRSLLVYDKFDIWEISPDGKVQSQLTHGQGQGKQYRIVEKNYRLAQPRYDDRFEGLVFNLEEPLLLSSFDRITKASGFYSLKKGQVPIPIGGGKRKLDQLFKAQRADEYLFREQTYGLSPRLMYRDLKKKGGKILQSSNPQQGRYQWGSAELIDFTNSVGDSLQGMLLYPAGYEVGKKYPMIVRIYEKQSQYLHSYINPSLYEMDGFNVTNFVLDGYAVLLPDIVYNSRGPGISALDCTLSAVNEVVGMGLVDPTKIGLIGHSFGGYETNFIVTQTDIFRAVVSGASVADLTSFQFSIDWSIGKTQEWRFTEQQWRTGITYFEGKEIFYRNSPLEHAERIRTPILLWTGNGDEHLNWLQDVEFYLALRRLKKEGKLLIYEREGHVLLDSKNQFDLSNRIKTWFDFFLKGFNGAEWINQKNVNLHLPNQKEVPH